MRSRRPYILLLLFTTGSTWVSTNGPNSGSTVRAALAPTPLADDAGVINVKSFGALGNGKALDTAAVNKAIEAAAAQGGALCGSPQEHICASPFI